MLSIFRKLLMPQTAMSYPKGVKYAAVESLELPSMLRAARGRVALSFNAGDFSPGTDPSNAIERSTSARLYDDSRGYRIEFPDGDDSFR
jgi:hypothetical protein